MKSGIQVTFHSSQFPEKVEQQFIDSLRSRVVNHKFHYDSVKQAERWMAVHRAYSPFQTDPGCANAYEAAFDWTARKIKFPAPLSVIGLGTGAGEKDVRLIEALVTGRARPKAYVPCDVSAALVLRAWQSTRARWDELSCHPVVCDLQEAGDLADLLAEMVPIDSHRLVTFFGMLPNFEPTVAAEVFSRLIRRDEYLLASANLAPGLDYEAGVRTVLPLYDNAPTREWLMTFLLDAGLERSDGAIDFQIEEGPLGLKRIAARFRFDRGRVITIGKEEIRFEAGETVRLFFSYRHTPERLRHWFEQCGLRVLKEWIADSGEEGVFLARRDG